MNLQSHTHSAGALSFQLNGYSGMIRDIRFHGCEILRAIYPAVRDAQWGTPPPHVALTQQTSTATGVTLQLSGRVVHADIDFEWQASISANALGTLEYRWQGKALRRFATGRTGLCILHPAEIAGAPCTIEHTDGLKMAGWFPQAISPHQPFKNIRAITHLVPGPAEVSVRMEGEVFEMEDQRNWTDASFKTYCRPLDWPRPYILEEGTTVEHVVRVSVQGRPAPSVPAPATAPAANKPAVLPRVGFTVPAPVPAEFRERMHALHPAHLRVETRAADLATTLHWARSEAEEFQSELHVALIGATVDTPPESLLPRSSFVALFDREGNTAPADVLAAWRQAGYTRIAAGTIHHFTELNRNRPPAHGAQSHTTFGINAQVHAFDDASLNETLTQHPVVARHAEILGAGRQVCIAPLVLGPAATTEDPRLRTAFAAKWVRQSLALLASTGCVESVTLFRTHGPGGILHGENATPLEIFLRRIGDHSTS